MNQPPPQPQQPPQGAPPQPQQAPQGQQPPMPQQAPGVGAPPPMPGQPPAGGQPPMPGQSPMGGQPGAPAQPYGQGQPPHMQQGWPGQQMPGAYPGHPAAGVRQPGSGNPTSAFFLGLLASFVVSAIYSAINAATLTELSYGMVNTLLIGHGLVNGAVVGWLVGLVGRRSTGAHIGGAVVAMLGAFFGFVNAVPFALYELVGFQNPFELVKHMPEMPVEVWWGGDGVGHLLSILSLLAAAGAAWGVAYLVGRRRP